MGLGPITSGKNVSASGTSGYPISTPEPFYVLSCKAKITTEDTRVENGGG